MRTVLINERKGKKSKSHSNRIFIRTRREIKDTTEKQL